MKLAEAIELFKKIEALQRPDGDHGKEWAVTLEAGGRGKERFFAFTIVPLYPAGNDAVDWTKVIELAAERDLRLVPFQGGISIQVDAKEPGRLSAE